MVDHDVVVAKIAGIEHALDRIAAVRRRRDAMPLEDYEDLVAVNLQRAVQDAIDLAAHVVASERWGVVDRVAESFGILAREGVIDEPLATRLRGMVGFRNLAVHQYQDIDPAIVERIVVDHLDDLRALAAAVVGRFRLAE